jgi:hypothetical protein
MHVTNNVWGTKIPPQGLEPGSLRWGLRTLTGWTIADHARPSYHCTSHLNAARQPFSSQSFKSCEGARAADVAS